MDKLINSILKLDKSEIVKLTSMLTTMITTQLTDLADVEICPYCESKEFVKNGTCNGKQRYLCKRCERSFRKNTNTIFSSTKLDLAIWEQAIRLMFSNAKCPLDDMVGELGVSKKTTLYIRHRLCDLLGACCNQQLLTGIVEADEMYRNINVKGHRQASRDGRKRGGKPLQGRGARLDVVKGLGRDKICILTAIDSSKHVYMKVVGTGRINRSKLDEHLKPLIDNNCIYCSDGDRSHIAFGQANNLEHRVLISGRPICEEGFHINNINNLHSQFKRWVQQFCGVSSKYLQSYLNWFMFLFKVKGENLLNKIVVILNEIDKQRTIADIYAQPRYIR